MRRQIEKSNGYLLEVRHSLPESSADATNRRFKWVGMGAPVDEDAPAGQVQTLVQTIDGDESVLEAAYAHRWEDFESLLHTDEPTPSGCVHVLRAVWVDHEVRYRGYARELVKGVKTVARRHGAQHLVARVGSTDSITQRWLQKLGFTIFIPEANLRVGGVSVPAIGGAVFAWIPLVNEPSVAVTATP